MSSCPTSTQGCDQLASGAWTRRACRQCGTWSEASVGSGGLEWCGPASLVLQACPHQILLTFRWFRTPLLTVVVQKSRHCHITPVLAGLHWLPVCQKINFKIVTTAFKVLHHHQPLYLAQIRPRYTPSRLLRSSSVTTSALFIESIGHLNNLPLISVTSGSLPALKFKLKYPSVVSPTQYFCCNFNSHILGLFLFLVIFNLIRYGGGNSTLLKRSSRFQRLFPNPSWLVWGRASRYQKLAPTFPRIDSCLMVTKWDFLEMEASLWLNGKSQNVAKGWLST